MDTNYEKNMNELVQNLPAEKDWAWEILQDYKKQMTENRNDYEKTISMLERSNKRLVRIIAGILFTIAVGVACFFTFFEVGYTTVTQDSEGSSYSQVDSKESYIGAESQSSNNPQ